MNFQENLWNNYEMVNNHFNQRRKALNDFITMINEMQKCDVEYSKNIKKIYDHGYVLTPEGTLGESLRITKEHFFNKYQYHSQMADCFKSYIVEPAKAFLEKQNIIGKSIYSEIKKVEKECKEALINLDKAQARFYTSAEAAENAMIDLEKAKESYEKENISSKSFLTLTEAKENEMAYIEALNKANALQVFYIKILKKNLQCYEQLEREYIEYTQEMIRKFYEYSDCCVKNIACDIEKGNQRVDLINCVKDIQTFIEPNQTNSKLSSEIEYQPYSVMLQFSPEKYQISAKMAYKIILALQNTFTRTAKYYDPIKEMKNIQINEISQQVCEQGATLTPQDKRALFQLLKEQPYRLTFLYYLNKNRSDGKFTLSFNYYNIIGDILNCILDEVSIDKDYESAKYCIILSQTFHYLGDNKEKIFLQERIKSHEVLKSAQFWENFIAYSLFQEIEKMQEQSITTETDEENNNRISNIVFAQLLPITDNMLEFSMEKEKIKEIINAFSTQYAIDEGLVWQMNKIIDDREYKPRDSIQHIEGQSSSSMMNEMNNQTEGKECVSYEVLSNEVKNIQENYMPTPEQNNNRDYSSGELVTSYEESEKDKSITP